MEISRRNMSVGTASRVQQPPVKFGSFSAQSLPELGNATKLIAPLMFGGIAYLMRRQFNKIGADLGETLIIAKETQELTAKGKTKQLIWNCLNSLGVLGSLGSVGFHMLKFRKLEPKVEYANGHAQAGYLWHSWKQDDYLHAMDKVGFKVPLGADGKPLPFPNPSK